MSRGDVLFLVTFFGACLVGSFGLGKLVASVNKTSRAEIQMENLWQD